MLNIRCRINNRVLVPTKLALVAGVVVVSRPVSVCGAVQPDLDFSVSEVTMAE